MKIRETRFWEAGMGGGHEQDCVREVAASEKLPPGAEKVADDTECHDWRSVREEN